MPVNHFLGKSQAWLEAQLTLAQVDFASGKTTTAAGAGDVSRGSTIEIDVRHRIEELLYALYLLAPITYPLAQIAPVTRTRIRFS